MNPDLRGLLLAIMFGGAIGLVVGLLNSDYQGTELIDWISYEPQNALLWFSVGALIVAGLWAIQGHFLSAVRKWLILILIVVVMAIVGRWLLG
jgi:hypothetical protein